MEGYAVTLGLTLKQVKGWFFEKRRRDNGFMLPILPIKKFAAPKERNTAGIFAARKNPKDRIFWFIIGQRVVMYYIQDIKAHL